MQEGLTNRLEKGNIGTRNALHGALTVGDLSCKSRPTKWQRPVTPPLLANMVCDARSIAWSIDQDCLVAAEVSSKLRGEESACNALVNMQ